MSTPLLFIAAQQGGDDSLRLYVETFVQSGYNRIIEGGADLPTIKPVSDLRNYSDVLRDIDIGQPVFLTKNGRGRYAIVDLREYEKTQATIQLMTELAKGEHSGIEKGWLSSQDVRARLGLDHA